MLRVEPTTDPAQWDAFLTQEAGDHASFLHSWAWLQMQQSYGRPVNRFVVTDGNRVTGVVGVIVLPLVSGVSCLVSPRGPLFLPGDAEAQLSVVARSGAFKEFARAHRAVFWRVEPAVTPGQGFRQVKDVQPAVTRMLDLNATEEGLLANMKQKTRYNVRLAAKKEVEVEFVTSESKPNWNTVIQQWSSLLEETSSRHGIRHHPIDYYRHMISTLGESGDMEVAIARHHGQVLAMNLNIGFGTTMTYVHGASTQQKKELMAPYALQWESIRRAKRQGFATYDFYGVAPEGQPKHPLAGVTRFKSGFGGRMHIYPGTYEFPMQPLWYTLYRTVKRFRSFV